MGSPNSSLAGIPKAQQGNPGQQAIGKVGLTAWPAPTLPMGFTPCCVHIGQSSAQHMCRTVGADARWHVQAADVGSNPAQKPANPARDDVSDLPNPFAGNPANEAAAKVCRPCAQHFAPRRTASRQPAQSTKTQTCSYVPPSTVHAEPHLNWPMS